MVDARLKRDSEVVSIQGGKGFVVLYINHASPPPPIGSTEEQAQELFIEWFDKLHTSPEVDPNTLPEKY
jgi:hypothetical protein